jgi:hypothetical protein
MTALRSSSALALLVLAAGAAGAAAAPAAAMRRVPSALGPVVRCATPDPSASEVAVCRRALAQARTSPSFAAHGGTIHVVAHVVSCGRSGEVEDAVLAEQISVLNHSYASSGFRFVLDRVERVEDCRGYAMTPGSAAEREFKTAHAVDPERRLNLWIVNPGLVFLGWATLPHTLDAGDPMGGVVVNFRTLPGGAYEPFNGGHTAVHEVGHYLGLYHTFQNGCVEPGDEVDDTPYQASPTSGCPDERNSCDAPGRDPIHNYMDYSNDACMEEFTPGQIERMREMVALYRPALIDVPLAGGRQGGSGRAYASRVPDVPQARIAPRRDAEARRPVLALDGAYPNPACGAGVVRFALPRADRVTLRLRDERGRAVMTIASGRFEAGDHAVEWTAAALSNGLYTLELESGEGVVRRLVLVEHAPGASEDGSI